MDRINLWNEWVFNQLWSDPRQSVVGVIWGWQSRLPFNETGLCEMAIPASVEVLSGRWFHKCRWLSTVLFQSGSRLSGCGSFSLFIATMNKTITQQLVRGQSRVIGQHHAFSESGCHGAVHSVSWQEW
jgi:hypothetical protein